MKIQGFIFEQSGDGDTESSARFSVDSTYRYELTRKWDRTRHSLIVIGLNPSTADASTDDPTIRRCVGFAKREGFGGLVMLNLFALRSTDPKAMLAHADPIGPDNDHWLRHYSDARMIVAAWGAHGGHRGRADVVRAMVPDLKCFGFTKAGHPRHPLYLKADTPLVDYERAP